MTHQPAAARYDVDVRRDDLDAYRVALLTMQRVPMSEMRAVRDRGVYAWWAIGDVPWPSDFPAVDNSLPLYIGLAERESLGDRANFHLGHTRGSAPRRSLAAVLVDQLRLADEIVPSSRPGKFGLTRAGEGRLSAWMGDFVRVTWVAIDEPGAVEKAAIGSLLPPLNDTHAAGSLYRRPLRSLRASVRAGAIGRPQAT